MRFGWQDMCFVWQNICFGYVLLVFRPLAQKFCLTCIMFSLKFALYENNSFKMMNNFTFLIDRGKYLMI